MSNKNTAENKHKFCSNYLGQTFINGMGSSSFLCPVDLNFIELDVIAATLLLRDVFDMDNSDFREFSVIKQNSKDKNTPLKLLFFMLSGEHKNVNNIDINILKFMHQYGYAINFDDISVKEMIEFGWIKIKNS